MNKLKDFCSDNYNIFSTILFGCMVKLLITEYCDILFNESSLLSSYFIIWGLFIYAIWSGLKEYKNNSKSLWIIIYGLMALLYNPIKITINYGYISYDEARILVIVTILILAKNFILNKEIYKKFLNK